MNILQELALAAMLAAAAGAAPAVAQPHFDPAHSWAATAESGARSVPPARSASDEPPPEKPGPYGC